MKSKVRNLVIIIFMAALLIGHGGQVARAQSGCDITVTDGGDSGPGTLRQAIIDVSSGGTICLAVDIGFGGMSYEINKAMTIDGRGHTIDNFDSEVGFYLTNPAYKIIFSSLYMHGNDIILADGGFLEINNSTILGDYAVDCTDAKVNINNATIANFAINDTATVLIARNSIYSLDNSTPVSPGNVHFDVANLGPLQDNGGGTLTMALLPGSPAIDTGDSITCLSYDQRGYIRPFGPACDVGAYEYDSVFPSPTPAATATTPPPASTPTPPPGPCGTTEQCLSTVIAQNGTVIAISSTTSAAVGGYVQPYTPTPNSFTATLSSGAVLEISRTTDYGNIFTSGLIIFMSSLAMLAGMVGLVMWRK